jgi:RNA polymerase sigma-70 factor (ECF subfamily)
MDDVEARALALLDAGDAREAADTAVRGYGQPVFRYVSGMLDPDDALDVLQLWSEDVWRGLPGFRRECRLRTWAYRLAHHAASRFRRDPYRARQERLPSSAASRLAVSIAAQSAVQLAARREQLRKLAATLTPEDQELLSLRLDRELSWEACAEIVSSDGVEVTAFALRKRWERLKDRLGRMAKDEGLID